MAEMCLTIDALEAEIRGGKKLLLMQPLMDAKSNVLIGTGKILTDRECQRFRDFFPNQQKKQILVRTVIPHFIEEEKRVKWAAYAVSVFEGGEIFKGMARQKKDFVSKYLKNTLIENDYLVWKLSQIKNFSRKLFDHSLNVCCIALATYSTYTQVHMQGMVDAMLVDNVIAASLLHAVGLLKNDPKLLEKKRLELAANSASAFFQYTVESYRLVMAESERHELTDPVNQALLSVEEYLDGTGSPRGISGTDMDFLSRLISLSNYFELLVSGEFSVKPRPYREYVGKIRAEKTKFDPDLMESLDLTFKHLFQI
jgi:HD-GYP domain-containing protein (c-di-GMP phosphodiesterase class II)